MVNRLYQNIVWGQRGNFVENPTDCPQRDERFGLDGRRADLSSAPPATTWTSARSSPADAGRGGRPADDRRLRTISPFVAAGRDERLGRRGCGAWRMIYEM